MNRETYYCDHIGILTYNAERLIKFYKVKLGFRFMSGERLPVEIAKKLFKINTTCCFFRLKMDNFILEIFEPHKKPKNLKRYYGIHHFGLKVQNRDQFINYLRNRKIKIITVNRNRRKVYFIEDPDKNMIELREAK